MKNVWITGARGFIGKQLADYLHRQGCFVSGIGHGAWVEQDARGCGVGHWVNGEIDSMNLALLQRQAGHPDAIFHLAGGSSVGPSFEKPFEDFRRTVEASARLFDWVKLESPHTRIICSSSAAVYGADHSQPISESSSWHPYSPYGYHKAMMEMLCRSYVESFGLKIAVVRLFSVYGVGLEKQLLWDLCSKLTSGNGHAVLGGTGEEIRDWINVSDVARLLALAATTKGEYLVVNGGKGTPLSIREVAATVSLAWGGGAEVRFSGQRRTGDPDYLVADISLANQLGFSPEISLESGITQYVEWFKNRQVLHD